MKYLSLIFVLLFALSAQAATFTVTNLNDSGAGSLRQAIIDAETASGDDTINFQSGLTGTITLTSGELIVNSNVIINGTGITVSGNNASRVFNFTANSNSSLNGLTVTGGLAQNSPFGQQGFNHGAGVNNTGALTIISCLITNNSAVPASGDVGSPFGGGIYNGGTMNLINSRVTGNTAVSSGTGGGIGNGGTLTITGSSISGNFAGRGAGFNNNGNLILSNSTINNNTANQSTGGGGIYNTGNIDARNSTISNNRATSGVGVFLVSGSNDAAFTIIFSNCTIAFNSTPNASTGVGGGIYVQTTKPPVLRNTIVANNSAGFGRDIYSSVNSQGHNLIGNTVDSSGYTATDILNQNAQLAALADNGGPTLTHALNSGSPAINAGDNTNAPATDQRGFARISGAAIDIGAYELQLGTTAAIVSVGGRVLTSDGRGITNVRLSLNASSGQVRITTTDANGYYRFSDVEAGSTYIITATGKRYTFSQPSQAVNVNDDTTEINFVGASEKRLRIF